MTILVHELELECEEVGQNLKCLHSLSCWLGDFTMFNTLCTGLYIVQGNILTKGRLRRQLVISGGKRRSRNQKISVLDLLKCFSCFIYKTFS